MWEFKGNSPFTKLWCFGHKIMLPFITIYLSCTICFHFDLVWAALISTLPTEWNKSRWWKNHVVGHKSCSLPPQISLWGRCWIYFCSLLHSVWVGWGQWSVFSSFMQCGVAVYKEVTGEKQKNFSFIIPLPLEDQLRNILPVEELQQPVCTACFPVLLWVWNELGCSLQEHHCTGLAAGLNSLAGT